MKHSFRSSIGRSIAALLRPFSTTLATSTLAATGLVVTGVALSGCQNGFQTLATPLASRLDSTIGCKNFDDAIWSSFYESVELNGRPPTTREIQNALKDQIQQSPRLGTLSANSQSSLISLTSRLAAKVMERNESSGIGQNSSQTDEPLIAPDLEAQKGLWLERIAQLELGDRTTAAKSADVDATQELIAELKKLAVDAQIETLSCADDTGVRPGPTPAPTPAPVPSDAGLFDHWKTTRTPAVYGGLKTVAVSYQSCEAATMNPLDGSTPNIKGIAVIGRHSSGTGNVREIRDLRAFLNGHPYLDPYRRPLPSCHDMMTAPLIYDYGGKPYTSSSDETVLNMFRNAGSGSKELGIDCSAFVYSAYAVSGLKLKKGTSLKASLVHGVSSSMMANPQGNGLTCLDHASFKGSSTLLPGDIVAIRGHVIMIENVGTDPFGIASIKTAADCKLANINPRNFNFTLFQSSPSKGSIGINRMWAKDYLTKGSTMGDGMMEHAVNACKAKFQSGTVASKSSKASIVRHLGTSDCIAPALRLAKEECLSSCPAR